MTNIINNCRLHLHIARQKMLADVTNSGAVVGLTVSYCKVTALKGTACTDG
jgi:hypothetical protein